MKVTMSSNSLKTFSKCPKKYYFSKVLGIEAREKSDAIKLGAYVDSIICNSSAHVDESDIDSVWLAKGRAIIRSMSELGILCKFDIYKKQEHVLFEISKPDIDVQVEGFIDLCTDNVIGEIKVSSRPELYLNKWTIGEQVGTYLMSKLEYLHVIMYVIRTPELKHNENKENVADYENRCFDDIMRRPGHYFCGFNNDKDNFGVKFMRQEFDIDNLGNKYVWLAKYIVMCHNENFWPDRRSECYNPTKCEYYEACNFGVSNDRYKKRERADVKDRGITKG